VCILGIVEMFVDPVCHVPKPPLGMTDTNPLPLGTIRFSPLNEGPLLIGGESPVSCIAFGFWLTRLI
jgi:hypothetical protein